MSVISRASFRVDGLPIRFVIVFLLLLILASRSLAHDPGLSTGQLRILPARIEVELTFATADIQCIVEPGVFFGKKVNPEELAMARPALEKLAREAWSMRIGKCPLAMEACAFRLDETNNFHLRCLFPIQSSGVVSARSLLIDRLPRGHRQFVTVLDHTNGVLAEMLLSAGQDVITADILELSQPKGHPPTHTFGNFLKLGIEHIVTGYDHLLFLFALLVMAPRFREAALIITSFTLAHSITLGLATLNVVSFGSKLVEPLIAATIVYVGVENLIRSAAPPGRSFLTFAFGLVHGFGFASALRELGVSSGTTGVAVPLLSFNLGVEVGQVSITALILPLIWSARRNPTFCRYAVPACSATVIALGACWFVQRAVL